ncbi:MAG: methylmalonyl-CoA mutase [Actinobacteria bacterium]|nr:methylmalonyl-CoA mutase [Actinomycetota bacterium]MCG2819750.1 methylmalonyl-CoA mutase family protein [Actinomycetes bacterium]MBU4179109.1 methylmalonyl-CoA mutase [Actinomycetota bacterium]MBU4219254.1 methylmalonyl-CoA mutase [Actinomycetota bacterium]MBU4359538.1 methylmalonyl-CoA mutase [Actinomycetota bacterium]
MNDDERNELEREKERWEREVLAPALSASSESRERFETVSGHEIGRLYGPWDLPDADYVRDIGFPGEYPFTRGIHSTMYRGRPWTIRQFMGFGDPDESNRRLKYLIEHGAPGLNVAFDMPTIHGLDSDHPLAHGEVGRNGVPLDSLEDMERLFADIPLAEVSTSLVIAYPPIPSMYLAMAIDQGADLKRLQGTFQNDSFCRDVAANVRVLPRRAELKLCTDVVEYFTLNVPRWYPISIVGYQIREKGCTAAQELAFNLSDGIEFVKSFINRGLDVDRFGPRLSFMWNAHNDFFEEIAKYRAARRMWAQIMKERFGARDPRSMMIRFHTQTAGCSLTAQQPLNNVVRATIQGLAAVLGGTQSLHTDSYDEAMALPTEESSKLAVRTQQIIAEESGVANTIDPMGGSYFVEKLTSELEEEAWEYINRIDEMGGMLEAVENGFIQREVARAAWRYQKDVESGKQVIVGVNKYVEEDEPPIELLKITQEMEDAQKERIARLKERRDEGKTREATEKLREAAENNENLFELTMDAVRAYATLEEVWDVYRDRYGKFEESSTLVESV